MARRESQRNAGKRSVWPYIIIGLLVVANLVVAALLVRDFRTAPQEEETTTVATVSTTATNMGESYKLTGGNLGAYGIELTLNAGTADESVKYVYVLPAGTYTVTNNGEYPVSVSMISALEKVKNEDTGLEEVKEQPDSTAKVIAPADSTDLILESGYGFAISKDEVITVERVA